MWPEFNTLNDPGLSVKDKVSYLQIINQTENPIELDANSQRHLKDTITNNVNSLLTRDEGLLLWLTSIRSSRLYLSNWGILLESSLRLSDCSSSTKLSLEILKEMMETFKNEAQFIPSFLNVWPRICQCLTDDTVNNEAIFLSLQCLKIAMNNFPVLVSPTAAEIQTYILNIMDCESNLVSEALSDCFCLIPKMMSNQFRFSSIWVGLFNTGTNTLDLQIRDIITFYKGVNGSRPELKPDDYFPITCKATEGLPLLLHKVRVFICLSKCLTQLLRTQSPECEARVEKLLEVLKLVFHLTDQITQSVTPFHLKYFSSLCISSLHLLESITLSFHIVDHTDSILAIMLKILNNEKINREPIYNREVRLAAWTFLCNFIKQYGVAASSKIVSDKIIGELICDISKKSEHTEFTSIDSQICLQALKVLRIFIQTAGNYIDKNSLKFIVNRVLECTRHVQLNLYILKTMHQPYLNEECRLELYNLLLDCCSNDHPLRDNCFRRSIHFFNLAKQDPSVEIITLMRRAKNFLNPKKHPPDYTFPTISKEQSSECQADIIAGWKVPTSFEGPWEQHNGEDEPMEMQQGPPAMYQVENAYQQAVADCNPTPSDRESPPHYQELQPANQYNNLKPYSRGSSRSESMDNSVEEDILEDEENMHSQLPHKPKDSDVQVASSNRPNIQILKAHTMVEEYVENEMEHQDEQSDHESIEEGEVPQPKSFVAENGTVEDSEDEEEAYDEDEAEEEFEEGNEEQVSSEPEERPIKKFKKDEEVAMNLEDEMSSEEECNKIGENKIEEIEENRDICDNEEESKPEINGEGASPSQTQEEPSVDEMNDDFVIAEPNS
ncbi:hypothetical protein JTE90_024928 [Oedothorax gibbosus]|uniref:Uncharacterized protein n=1 Tax=Oedothorax gibbosus TaxID=931172 RepID=A0AAV6TWZ6_9ARAC|nr:hypothetical protein JTE90_024928 [Oedothorax gibbosus]